MAGAALAVDDTFHTALLSQMGPVAVVSQFIRNPDAPHYFSLIIISTRHLPLFLTNNQKAMENADQTVGEARLVGYTLP